MMASESDATMLQLYIQKVKIATAIAIIRMTPSGMSAEDYAAELGEQVLQHSDAWVTKSPNIEKLIHSLEQSFCQESQQSAEFSGSVSERLSSSQNKGNALVPCTSSQSAFPGAIIPSNTFAAFMNSLLYLKSITSSNSSCANEPDLLYSISESLGKLFRHLKSETGCKMPIDMAEKAIKTVHGLFCIKEETAMNLVMDTCLFFIDSLIFDVINTIEINMFQKQHRFSALIQIMAQHSALTIMILSKLMQEIINFQKSLETRSTLNIYKLHPVVAMENVYFIFQTIEGIIYNLYRPEDNRKRTLSLSQEVLDAWLQMVERITEQPNLNLPMFCTYLFKVHSIIIAAFKLHETNNQ